MGEINFRNSEVYLFRGPVEFCVRQGALEAVGSRLESGTERHFIPLGKSIPVEARADAVIDLIRGSKENIEQLKERTIPEEWDLLAERIRRENARKVIVLGEMDTGKSFLTTYLANRLVGFGKKTGIIDSDLGQSDIGPPGTIGLALLERPVMFLPNAKVQSLEFVGAHSAGLHMVSMMQGFRRIVEESLRLAEATIVNTSGWIMGDGGRLLAGASIDLLEPDIIVLMQRKNECEHLVRRIFPKTRVVPLKVSRKASETSKGDREKLRNLASQTYFSRCRDLFLDWDSFETDQVFFKTGEPVRDLPLKTGKVIHFAEKYPSYEGLLVITSELLSEAEIVSLNRHGFSSVRNVALPYLEGILLGLRDERFHLCDVGILKGIDFKQGTIHILTPYTGRDSDIRIIQFGALRYRPDGTENGFLEPGSL